MTIISVFLLIIVVFIFVYHLWNIYSYWRRKSVIGPTPLPILGNYASVILRIECEGDFLRKIYERYPNEKYVGIYKGLWPVLVIRDPNLIKQVLKSNYDNFQERCVEEPMKAFNKNLFLMRGDEKWKTLRSAISPAFTKSKLSQHLPSIRSAVDKYLNFIDSNIVNDIEDIDVRYIQNKYILESVGRIILGVNINAFGKTGQFQKAILTLLESQVKTSVLHTIQLVSPAILKLVTPLVRKVIANKINAFRKFITSLIHGPCQTSKCTLIDFMANLRVDSKLVGEAPSSLLDHDTILQQSLVLILASYESTSSSSVFMIHELAKNQNVQEKCYEEVMSILNKYNGEFTMQTLSEMRYLEMVFDETLRMHHLNQMIDRKCTSKYTFSGTNLTIDEEIMIILPTHGIHKDAKYFPNPDKLDPERFSPQNKFKIPQCVYLPFGDGPRYCMGSRLAKMMVLMCMAGLLKKFRLLPSERTRKSLKYDPNNVITVSPLGGIWVRMQARDQHT